MESKNESEMVIVYTRDGVQHSVEKAFAMQMKGFKEAGNNNEFILPDRVFCEDVGYIIRFNQQAEATGEIDVEYFRTPYLMQLVSAVHSLGPPGFPKLLNLLCKTVAERIENASPEEQKKLISGCDGEDSEDGDKLVWIAAYN